MLRKIASSLPLLLLVPAAGCFAESGDPAPGQSTGTLSERLAEPVALGIVPTDEGSFARLTAVALRDGREIEVEIHVVEGALAIALDDDQLRVEGMEVSAADVEVGPGVMPPDGATFTRISIALASPFQVDLTSLSDTAARVEADLPLDVHWAVALDHGVVDLAPIQFPELRFELALELDADGAIEAHLAAAQPGPFWSWAGIFELRDLEVALVGSTEQTAPGSIE